MGIGWIKEVHLELEPICTNTYPPLLYLSLLTCQTNTVLSLMQYCFFYTLCLYHLLLNCNVIRCGGPEDGYPWAFPGHIHLLNCGVSCIFKNHNENPLISQLATHVLSIYCMSSQIAGCQTFWSQDPLILLKIIEEFQDLLFIGIIYIDIFHI